MSARKPVSILFYGAFPSTASRIAYILKKNYGARVDQKLKFFRLNQGQGPIEEYDPIILRFLLLKNITIDFPKFPLWIKIGKGPNRLEFRMRIPNKTKKITTISTVL